MIRHAEVILTFIFINSLMTSAPNSELSSGHSKLTCDASQCQAIRRNLFLSKRQYEFQVLITPWRDAGTASTEGRLLQQVLLWAHKPKEGALGYTSNLELSLHNPTRQPSQQWSHVLCKPVNLSFEDLHLKHWYHKTHRSLYRTEQVA